VAGKSPFVCLWLTKTPPVDEHLTTFRMRSVSLWLANHTLGARRLPVARASPMIKGEESTPQNHWKKINIAGKSQHRGEESTQGKKSLRDAVK